MSEEHLLTKTIFFFFIKQKSPFMYMIYVGFTHGYFASLSISNLIPSRPCFPPSLVMEGEYPLRCEYRWDHLINPFCHTKTTRTEMITPIHKKYHEHGKEQSKMQNHMDKPFILIISFVTSTKNFRSMGTFSQCSNPEAFWEYSQWRGTSPQFLQFWGNSRLSWLQPSPSSLPLPCESRLFCSSSSLHTQPSSSPVFPVGHCAKILAKKPI